MGSREVCEHFVPLQFFCAECAKGPTIKFIGPRPTKGSEYAACFDLASTEQVALYPREPKWVSTGLRVAVPEGYSLDIRSRSGNAGRGLIVANSPGTVDSDFRGEVKVCLLYTGPMDRYVIKVGDRIAQCKLTPVIDVQWEEVEELDETERGEGGFGSTGV